MLEERASVCTFDCPDTCSLTVGVENGRVVKVRGSGALPYTAGVICNKVARDMGAFVHGPQRLLHPLRRAGPKRLRTIRAHLMGRCAGRNPRASQRGDPPLGAAGGDAAQLRRPARLARRRQHVGAVLQPARRHPALPPGICAAVCAAKPGPEPTARSPDARPSSPSMRQLNVVWGNNATVANLHLVRSDPQGQARRRQARRHRPAAHEDRRASGPPFAIAARHRCRCSPGRVAAELERSGSLDDVVHRRPCAGRQRSSWRWPGSGRHPAQLRPAVSPKARS